MTNFGWQPDSKALLLQTTVGAKPQISESDAKKPQPVTVTRAPYKLNGVGLLKENVTYELRIQQRRQKTSRLMGKKLLLQPSGYRMILMILVRRLICSI